jgi:hypothetical protein
MDHGSMITTNHTLRAPTSGRRPRRALTVLAGATLAAGMLAAPAAASGPDMSKPHPHALLLHVDMSNGFTYERCIDLAGGRALPRNNHHGTVHTGTAGDALKDAGHLVVPYTCAELEAFFGS